MTVDIETCLAEGIREHQRSKIPRIIGIHGFMKSGKDTAADILKRKLISNLGFKEDEIVMYPFAGPVKEILIDNFGLTRDDVYTQEGKIRINNDFGMLNREILQQFATEAMRDNLHKDVWLIAMKYKIAKSKAKVIIIPDVRFKNEFELIKRHNGMICHVIRKLVDPIENMSLFRYFLYKIGLYKLHESERPVDTKGFRVFPIINNEGLKELESEVEAFIVHMMYLKDIVKE